MSKVEARKELIVIIGDANRLVGNIIPGNDEKVSFGGKFIRNLVKTDKYVLVNGTSKVTGGPGTREDPANPAHKSALDLVIVSAELEEHVDEMVIDSSRKFTPFRRHSNGKISYSDHFGISVTFKNLNHHSSNNKFVKKYTRWNTNKQNGWNIYKDLTTNNVRFEQIASSPSTDPDELMRKISRELEAVKYKSFGKVKVKNKMKKRT